MEYMDAESTIVLGDTGMLGSMVARIVPSDTFERFDVREVTDLPDKYRYINCIGLIKPRITSVEDAVTVNTLFPLTLPPKTIQIATDCVYSGRKGAYIESDPHDALDVYGKTKSLGENPALYNLRCSIIGPEVATKRSLLEWFLGQTEVNGFTNHYWNGVTTYHFAKICKAIIENDLELPSVQHIVPADIVTKAELLQIIAKAYKKDTVIHEVEALERIDRTLETENKRLNRRLWKLAGYDYPPSIQQMVEELAAL